MSAAAAATASAAAAAPSRAVPTDHYSLLGVDADASAAQVASAYRALALRLHPDKAAALALTPAERRSRAERFTQLQQAYHVLSRKDSRQQYDAALKAGGLLCRYGGSSGGGVGTLSCAEVDLDDIAFDEASSTYSHPCRCGCVYRIEEATLIETGVDLFPCAQCSLVVRVMFEWQPSEADAAAQAAQEAEQAHAATAAVQPSPPPIHPNEMG